MAILTCNQTILYISVLRVCDRRHGTQHADVCCYICGVRQYSLVTKHFYIFQFYESVMEGMVPNMPTGFMTFVEYGNINL